MDFLKWRKADGPDEPAPRWTQSFERISSLRALGLRALFVGVGVKLWVFTLSALGIISGAGLGRTAGIIAYLLYIVLAQVALIGAIVVYAVVPTAAALLARAPDWLTRYNRPISIAVGLTFGLYFGYSGIRGLLSSAGRSSANGGLRFRDLLDAPDLPINEPHLDPVRV